MMKKVFSLPSVEPLDIGETEIEITNLRLRTYIGFNPEEREKKQDIIVNAQISYRADSVSVTLRATRK